MNYCKELMNKTIHLIEKLILYSFLKQLYQSIFFDIIELDINT